MNNTLTYKNYVGSVEFSEEDGVFFGQVLGVGGLLSYEGTTVPELTEDFHGVVDDYLQYCKDEGIQPEVPFSTPTKVELEPKTRKLVTLRAAAEQVSLSAFVEEVLQNWFAAHPEN